MKQAHATNSATTTNTANSYIQGINHCSDTDLGSKAPEAAGNAGTQTSSSDGSGVSVDVIDMCRELETHSLRSIDDESSDGDGEGDNDDEAVLMKQLADLQKSMQEIRSKLDSKKRSTLSLGVAGSENEDCSEDDEELDSSFSSYLSSEASSLSSSPVASPAQSSCSLSPSSSPLSNVAGARLKTAFLSARSRITSQQKPEQGRETQTFPSSLYNVPTDQNGQMVMSSLNSSRPFLLLPKTPKPRSNRVHIPVLGGCRLLHLRILSVRAYPSV